MEVRLVRDIEDLQFEDLPFEVGGYTFTGEYVNEGYTFKISAHRDGVLYGEIIQCSSPFDLGEYSRQETPGFIQELITSIKAEPSFPAWEEV